MSKSIPFQDENNNSDISTTYFTSTPHKEPADARTQETAIQNPVVTVQQVDARTQETAIQSPVVTVQQVDYKEPEDERTHETAILNLTPVVTVPHDAPVDLSLKVSRNTNKKKPKAYNCNSCNYSTCDASNLRRHKHRRHQNKTTVCKECNKAFKDPYEQRQHFRSIHENIKLICELCSKYFNNRQSLRRHKLLIHSSCAPYICNMCNQRFVEKRSYHGHINKHMHFKPYNCGICNKEFSYKYSMERHLLSCSNTDKDKLKCEKCEKTFKTAASKKEHLKGAHGPRVYSCMCGKTFAWKSALCRHKKNCNITT